MTPAGFFYSDVYVRCLVCMSPPTNDELALSVCAAAVAAAAATTSSTCLVREIARPEDMLIEATITHRASHEEEARVDLPMQMMQFLWDVFLFEFAGYGGTAEPLPPPAQGGMTTGGGGLSAICARACALCGC